MEQFLRLINCATSINLNVPFATVFSARSQSNHQEEVQYRVIGTFVMIEIAIIEQ